MCIRDRAEGKAENKKPDALMISSVKVVGNKATVILSGASEGAAGYDLSLIHIWKIRQRSIWRSGIA